MTRLAFIGSKEKNKMKLEVYKEMKKDDQKEVYLDLITYEQLSIESGFHNTWDKKKIALVARDKSGKIVSALFGFRADGTYVRCTSIDKSLGFELDECGQIVEYEPL